MTQDLTRRAALGSLAAGAVLALPAIARGGSIDELGALIAAHETARQEFMVAVDDLEAAAPNPKDRVVGIAGCDYAISDGRERIERWIKEHFDRLAGTLQRVAQVWPAAGVEGLAAIEHERDAALARLDETFAVEEAAELRWRDKRDAEAEALKAICAHRCGSPEDLARKFRYLVSFRGELLDEEYQDAIFSSLLPDGEAI